MTNPEGRLLLFETFDAQPFSLAVPISYGIGLADDVQQLMADLLLQARARRLLAKNVACWQSSTPESAVHVGSSEIPPAKPC